MARELGCDEGTVRRDIAKLQLPEDSLEAIEKGAPAEQFLRLSRLAAALLERKQRLQSVYKKEQQPESTAMRLRNRPLLPSWKGACPCRRSDDPRYAGAQALEASGYGYDSPAQSRAGARLLRGQ